MFSDEDHDDDFNSELEKRETLLKKDLESEKIKYISQNNNSKEKDSSHSDELLLDSELHSNKIISTSDEDSSLSIEDIEELKELICNWLDLDEKSKELSDQMKDLKLEKKQYETYILEFMDKAKKEVIKSNDNTCTLRKDVKETKGSLKEDHILKILSKILSNSEQAYKITQQIIEELPSKEVISLKKDKNNTKTFKKTKATKKDI